MKPCPGCLGEGEHDITDLLPGPVELLVRLADYAVVIDCEACEGTGEVTEAELRDWQAWVVARTDQFFAAEKAGEFS